VDHHGDTVTLERRDTARGQLAATAYHKVSGVDQPATGVHTLDHGSSSETSELILNTLIDD
jgi:hypothetical protein